MLAGLTLAAFHWNVSVGQTPLPQLHTKELSNLQYSSVAEKLAVSKGLVPPTPKKHIQKNVLLVNSYHPGFTFEDEIFRGLNDKLAASPIDVEFSIEYLDTKNHDLTSEYKELLRQIFEVRHGDITYDAIVAADDNALDFVHEFHEELFHSAPVVFTGISRKNIGQLVNRTAFTGVLEHEAAVETLKLALKLHPGTKRVEMVFDDTPTSNSRWEAIRRSFHEVEGVTIVRMDNSMTLPQMATYLSRLDTRTIVGFGSYYREGTGQVLSMQEGAEFITRNSPRPVYTFHSQIIPFGVVGGLVVSGYEQGQQAAHSLVRLLSGINPKEIALISDQSAVPIFNYPELTRFGISTDALPANSKILGKPLSVFEVNHKIAVGTIILILFLGSAILWNLKANRSLKLSRMQVKEALDRAEMANQAKDVFLANVSHELRTPLNAIIGFSALMRLVDGKNETPGRDKTIEYSDAISISGIHLLTIVNSLIGITSIQSGQYEVIPRKTSFRKIMAETAKVLEGDRICKHATVTGDCLDETVFADASLMGQVLANLMLNAYQHNPRGTRIIVSLKNDANQTRIEVEDNGLGISSEKLKQCSSSRWDLNCANQPYVSDTDCLGLGIRFSRLLVEKHGGSLIIESQIQCGTKVIITLPNFSDEPSAQDYQIDSRRTTELLEDRMAS